MKSDNLKNKETYSFENVTKNSFLELEKLEKIDDLLSFEKKYLKSKESYLSFFISEMKSFATIKEKTEKGKRINIWKNGISDLIEIKKNIIISRSGKKNNNKSSEKKPNHLVSKQVKLGSFHLIRKSLSDIYSFFVSRGYEIFEANEVETKWYNFDGLNLKWDHPARRWSDTFYFSEDSKFLLRTHTSNSQTRIMGKNKNKEIMIVSGGKVYRNDDDDLTHSHQYTNIEIIRIDKKSSFANLKWMLEDFFQWFFKRELKTRFRPSFFPFTEPSFEVDVSCSSCKNDLEKCKVCKGTGWIEILGAGLINPIVLKNSGYDEKNFSGFAAGIGLERILMIKYGINDIRDFYSNDPRFLVQTSWK